MLPLQHVIQSCDVRSLKATSDSLATEKVLKKGTHKKPTHNKTPSIDIQLLLIFILMEDYES